MLPAAPKRPETPERSDPVATPLSRLKLAAELLLGRPCNTADDFQIMGTRLARAAKRRAGPYGHYYIKAVFESRKPISAPLMRSIDLLLSELTATSPSDTVEYSTVKVRVPPGVEVTPGSIVLTDSRTCVCGEAFIPTIWNQKSHTAPCAALREQMHRRMKWQRKKAD